MRPQKYQKLNFHFLQESPRRGDSLDRFRNFLGAFICLTIPHQRFKFHVIRITGYGVIAEKPRVGQFGRIFPCTLYEKLCVGSKEMNRRFLMVSPSSITIQSLGKIAQRAPAVGAKIRCLSLFFSVCHALRPVFSDVFRRDCSFRCTTQFSYLSLGGAAIFAKLRSKITKSPKIGGNVCAHHFVCRQLRDLKKIPLQQFRAENVDVHLYNFFQHVAIKRRQQVSNFVWVFQKRLGMNKFVRTKVIQEVIFPKHIWGFYAHDGLQLYTYIAVFLCGVSWCYSRATNSEPHFWSFFTTLKNDSVANYASIWTPFAPSIRGPDVCCSAQNISQFRPQMAPPDSLICDGNIPKLKNSAAELCEILRIVTIYIVINSTHVQQHKHVTISYRNALSGMGRCFCFLSRSECGAPCVRGVHSSNKHYVAVYWPISTRFSGFFYNRFLFQMRYTVLTFVARWRHNVREIASKIAKSQQFNYFLSLLLDGNTQASIS